MNFLSAKNIILLFVLLVLGALMIYISYNKHYQEVENISTSPYIFGIDVSHYQGMINWSKVKKSRHPIKFIFMRSTMGINGKDVRFQFNWSNAKRHGYVRGAYHYYRPNENSTKQFLNYASSVSLQRGDFAPILDVERTSRFGAKHLREGVLNWLRLAEEGYGIKPIIYTGRTFYHKYLKGYVQDYSLWIASYSGKHKLRGINWTFHQFTQNVRVKGINRRVDGNDFKGEWIEFQGMCLK